MLRCPGAQDLAAHLGSHYIRQMDGQRQTLLAERELEDGPRGACLCRVAAAAVEQEARAQVGDRQPIAVGPVAGAELALESCVAVTLGIRPPPDAAGGVRKASCPPDEVIRSF